MNHTNEFDQIIGEPIKNWSPAKRPPKTPMQGRYSMVEPLHVARHASKLFEAFQIANRGESWTYLPYGPFYEWDEFQDWLIKTASGTDPMFHTIIDAKSGLPVGLAAYSRVNPEHGCIEIGHLHFSKLMKQTAVATEAMYLMMRRAFDELGYRRYEWKCDLLNEPSKAAAQRLGFKFEGVFRQDKVVKNRNRDTAWYSIIDQEWPELRIRLEKWLDPRNFHADGKQLVRLVAMRDPGT